MRAGRVGGRGAGDGWLDFAPDGVNVHKDGADHWGPSTPARPTSTNCTPRTRG
ncbi:hypothetical protein O1L60_36460 [Streptomyces diastatochromogenes]|nr:hypothetical protein [Streptomyces diastatochromogenes]